MDIIILLLVFAAGYFIGAAKAYVRMALDLKELAESKGFDLEKELLSDEPEKKPVSVYKLAVEQHGDVLYLFDKEKDQFICQGSSVQELAKLAKQYNNIVYAAVLYGDKIFAFKDGESTEVSEIV